MQERRMTDQPTEIARLAAWLTAVGVRPAGSWRSSSFGDQQVDYERDRLLVRIGSERGRWFIDVSGDSERWYDMDDWQACLDGCGIPDTPSSLETQAALLRDRLPEIEQAISSPSWDNLADCLRETHADKIFKRLGIPRPTGP